MGDNLRINFNFKIQSYCDFIQAIGASVAIYNRDGNVQYSKWPTRVWALDTSQLCNETTAKHVNNAQDAERLRFVIS